MQTAQEKAIAIARLRKRAEYFGKKRVDVLLHGIKPQSNINPRKGSRFGTEQQALNHYWKEERLTHIKLAELEGTKLRDDF